ncbi:M43 family zinc metalloprotease [Psychroflexus salinarum]|uniref:M43 family zinc metalloprotease n=1 Tax=Psychroflexus salinarum TaxID=546024 RepID=A0ABW3GPB3_9FLAO
MYNCLKLYSLLCFFLGREVADSNLESNEFCIYNSLAIESNWNQCTPDPSFSYSTDPEYLGSFSEIVIPVVFWGINQTDNSNKDPLTQSKVEESLKLLNSTFEEMNICFELQKLKFINNSEIFWTDYYKFNRYVKNNYTASADVLNIYVPFKFTNFENNLRGGKWSPNQMSVNMLNYNTGILPHEVGHTLGLLHTHTGAKAVNCEHITRDENDPDYNAKCTGDRVTDTNAMPDLYGKFHLIDDDCEYNGDIKNCKGLPYKLTEMDVRNFMGYTKHSCRSIFTTGQGVRVREFIKNSKESGKMSFINTK